MTGTEQVQESIAPVDWIFVVDTSASMSGHQRGFSNIFPDVQKALHQFVPEIRNGDGLTVIVFDASSRIVSLDIPKIIRGDYDRKAVDRLIDSLSARGAWTYTGAALTDALSEVTSRTDRERPAIIILFTDGHEDIDPSIKNPTRIPAAAELIPDKDIPYVFYVSLGTEFDPQLLKFLSTVNGKAAGHGIGINDPGAQNLAGKVEEIRKSLIEVRTQPRFKPPILDLGQIRPGGRKGPVKLELFSPVSAAFRIRPVGVPADHKLEGMPEAIVCDPSHWQSIQFTLAVSDNAQEGIQNYELEIEHVSRIAGQNGSRRSVPIKVDVRWTPWQWFLHRSKMGLLWIVHRSAGLIAVILLVLLVLYLWRRWRIHDEPPWEVIRRLFGPRHRVPAMLRTPEGTLPLSESITLGNGNGRLSQSPATVIIKRVGDDHHLIVERGTVTSIDPTGLMQRPLNVGDKLTLKHKASILMPGYTTPLEYLNGSLAGRRR